MLGAIVSRVVGGALWGVGAAAVIAATSGQPSDLRTTTKRVIKACLLAADQAQLLVAEAREVIEDVYAEIRQEQAEAPVAESRSDLADGTARAVPVSIVQTVRGAADDADDPRARRQ